MRAARVGIVGARRRRQGLGPYVARDLVAAGAAVPCFLVTQETSVAPARAALREAAGIEPRAHLDLARMLEEESLDALAILSPAECHAEHLAAAAAAGLHVLCEKPFVWGSADPAGDAAALLGRFAARGLLVWENCQWPYTLAGFEALHPGALREPPRRFEMHLEPMTLGLQGLADALPHTISLLQALVPGDEARVEAPDFSTREPDAEALSIRFRYRTELRACDVAVRLECGETQPRQAGYSLDARRARRVVAAPDYRLFFADADRSVPIADPLTQLVADFVAALGDVPEGVLPTTARRIHQRMQLLAALAAAYQAEEAR